MKSPVKFSMMDRFETSLAEWVKVMPKIMRKVPKATRSPMRIILLLRRSRVRSASLSDTTCYASGRALSAVAVATRSSTILPSRMCTTRRA